MKKKSKKVATDGESKRELCNFYFHKILWHILFLFLLVNEEDNVSDIEEVDNAFASEDVDPLELKHV